MGEGSGKTCLLGRLEVTVGARGRPGTGARRLVRTGGRRQARTRGTRSSSSSSMEEDMEGVDHHQGPHREDTARIIMAVRRMHRPRTTSSSTIRITRAAGMSMVAVRSSMIISVGRGPGAVGIMAPRHMHSMIATRATGTMNARLGGMIAARRMASRLVAAEDHMAEAAVVAATVEAATTIMAVIEVVATAIMVANVAAAITTTMAAAAEATSKTVHREDVAGLVAIGVAVADPGDAMKAAPPRPLSVLLNPNRRRNEQ